MTDTRTNEELLEAIQETTRRMTEHGSEGEFEAANTTSEELIALLEEYLKRDDVDFLELMKALAQGPRSPLEMFEEAKAAVNEFAEDFEKTVKANGLGSAQLQQLKNMSVMAGMLAQAYVAQQQKIFENFLTGLLNPGGK
ncbi:MAG: hypothetical protein VX730_07855 [Pseudomonadota bacterium]|nr:hypothetical protein [Pseudomonadota bacterium]